jgi:hypothetical protein
LGGPQEGRVPKRSTGAEQPVVVKKARNRAGAKGLYCSALYSDQPAEGRNLVNKAKPFKGNTRS